MRPRLAQAIYICILQLQLEAFKATRFIQSDLQVAVRLYMGLSVCCGSLGIEPDDLCAANAMPLDN